MKENQESMASYAIQTELEFQRIISKLEESDIVYSTKIYQDANFPSLANNHVFGEIFIDVENTNKLQAIIDALNTQVPLPAEPDNHSPQRKPKNIWRMILIAYAIIVSIMCVRYKLLVNRGINFNNTTTSEWGFQGKELIVRDKKTQDIIEIYQDANFNDNYELITSYSVNGNKVAINTDFNDNGFKEIFYHLNENEEKTITYIDRDEDGMYEEILFILENKDTLRLLDSNKNGDYELEKP